MLGEHEIVQRFLDTKLQVHPDVVGYIRDQDDPALIERIISSVPSETVVVSTKHIPGITLERDGARFLADPLVEVKQGSGEGAAVSCSFEDFVHYFRDRFTRLGDMVRSRNPAMPIEALKSSRYNQQECTIIGMVGEVRTTGKGHRLAEVEDPTGVASVLFNKDRPCFQDAEKLLPDEVIGLRGKLSSDGKLFFADRLFRPDIPINHAPFSSQQPGTAVLISDIHLGSNTFLEEQWLRFSDWLDDNPPGYLLVAGDLVDGIGIYPSQEEELVIKDIYEQYDRLGSLLRDIPGRTMIVLSPGNHDVVRAAEPQPVIPGAFAGSFPKNSILVENPCLLSIQGVRVLMYHGRSIDDMIGLIPGASYARPEQMMIEMLQRRHLAPTYGKRTSIAAQRQDRMVIDHIPEILHTGHVHTCGLARYRGVLGINAGAWQSQTAFQKQMNIHPTPARAVVVNLQTLEPEIVDFS